VVCDLNRVSEGLYETIFHVIVALCVVCQYQGLMPRQW